MSAYGPRTSTDIPEAFHASMVAAKIIGKQLGTAKEATLWVASSSWNGRRTDTVVALEVFRNLEAYVNILEHIASHGWARSSVLSTSCGLSERRMPVYQAILARMSKSLLPKHLV